MGKQYLMMVDEAALVKVGAVFSGIQFIEVQGMDIGSDGRFKIMVTPVIPPLPGVAVPVKEGAEKASE